MRKFCIGDIEIFVDEKDFHYLEEHKWWLAKKENYTYVVTDINKKRVYLHQLIMGKKEGYVIDHIDRNPLNNCKCNLRFATKSENAYNSKIRSDNVSGYRGVSYDKSRNKWVARIKNNTSYKFLGRFETKELALKRIDEEETLLFGKPRRQRTFVLGDIHARYDALIEVLDKSKFDYEHDKLIVLGDECDGGSQTRQVIEELLKIKHLVLIRGNHTQWFMDYIKDGSREEIWLQQGGANTLRSYGALIKLSKGLYNESYINTSTMDIPQSHIDFLNSSVMYHVEDDMLFVHGGIDTSKTLDNQDKDVLLWDRNLCNTARQRAINYQSFKWIFVGHTTTQTYYNSTKPLIYDDLVMMDTGAGFSGKLTIMDIKTQEYWQSKTQVGGR